MDSVEITQLAVAYALALMTKAGIEEFVDPRIKNALRGIVAAVTSGLFGDKRPNGSDVRVILEAAQHPNPQMAMDVETVASSSTAIRRAQLVQSCLHGTRILWVDDQPANNIWEQRFFTQLGVHVEVATNSEEAILKLQNQQFDLILSDIARDGRSDEGLAFLRRIREGGQATPVVFYVGHVDSRLPTPLGAFGIADMPEPLFHFVFDILERQRV